MASVAHCTPVRQPFGLVDNSRLASLQSKKNLQNAILSNNKNSNPLDQGRKRRHVSDSFDSENIDPLSLNPPSKRKCDSIQDSACKTSRIVLTPTPRINTITPRLSIAKRPETASPIRPRSLAGRSPPSKVFRKAFSRRSTGASYKRIDPPSARSAKIAPLSLASALNNTLQTYQPKMKDVATIEESQPKSWSFDIYVDTEEEELQNLMEHSTCVLDISDDETSKQKSDRGKENIPPHQLGIEIPAAPVADPTLAPVTPTKAPAEPRSPLGELKASDYYPEGLDENSVVAVNDDDEDAPAKPENNLLPSPPKA